MPQGAVNLIDIFGQFGFIGLVLYIWYVDHRRFQTVVDEHKAQISAVLESYRTDMTETRRMYENNVELVKSYQILARDLHDVVILNTQGFQKTLDAVMSNQFCPLNRIEKKQTQGGR